MAFRFQDVVKEFPDKHPVYLARTLADMVDRGMLYKIARNLYHIIPLNAGPESYEPDRFQVAKYLMLNKEYYIGYASALDIHSLSPLPVRVVSDTAKSGTAASDTGASDTGASDTGASDAAISDYGKPENKVYVVTPKQMNPGILNVGKTTYHFIPHRPTRFFGFDSIWINQIEEAMVSSLERTIVDCATKPQYCGGITELGKILFQANNNINYDYLFSCLSRNSDKSAKKRILFLSDFLGIKWSERHDLMLKEIGSGISLLDPSVPDQGRKRSDFGLKINVDPWHIKRKVFG